MVRDSSHSPERARSPIGLQSQNTDIETERISPGVLILSAAAPLPGRDRTTQLVRRTISRAEATSRRGGTRVDS